MVLQIGTREGQGVYLTAEDRQTHAHVIGDSGQGKSYLLAQMIRSDITDGHGVCVIDPHGELYDMIVDWMASHDLHRDPRFRGKIHLLDPRDPDWTVGLNPLVSGTAPPWARAGAMVQAFQTAWGGREFSETPRLAKCLQLIFYALAHNRLSTAEARHFVNFTMGDVRRKYTSQLDNPTYESFWHELNDPKVDARQFRELFESTTSRLLAFLGTPPLEQTVGQVDGVLDFRRCMDDGHVLLVNLNGAGGPNAFSYQDAKVIGAMVASGLFLAAQDRTPALAKARPFYCYIDECADFLTDDIAKSLYQTRKYGLHYILSHQDLQQLREHGDGLFRAVMGGAQTKLVFRTDDDDTAEVLARRLYRKAFDMTETVVINERPVVVDYSLIWLFSSSTTTGTVDSETWSQTIGAGNSGGSGLTVAIEDALQHLPETGLQTDTDGWSEMNAETKGGVSARVSSTTDGQSQSVVPVIEWLANETHKSLEEHIHDGIVAIRGLPKRQVLVQPVGQPTFRMSTLEVGTLPVSSEKRAEFVHRVSADSPYCALRRQVIEDMRERDQFVRGLGDTHPIEDDDFAFEGGPGTHMVD